MNEIKSFKEAYDFLVMAVPKSSGSIFKGEDGFDRSRHWMDELSNPQDVAPAIHVAGTSGKGTVAYLISAILKAHNKSTGLITSPHAYDILERILINQVKLSKVNLVKLINELMPSYLKMKRDGVSPSYFEVLMALGFMATAQANVDYCIVETGMGGKLDTSNTIHRKDKLCIITPIGYDHTHILGYTLTQIAAQKVGIVKEGQQVFSAKQIDEVTKVIKEHCNRVGAKLDIVDTKFSLEAYELSGDLADINVQLTGKHNRSNLVLALSAVRYLAKRDGWDLDNTSIKKALKEFKLPGRFEVVKGIGEKEFIFDGAHNEQKMSALIDAMRDRYGKQRFGAVFASSKKHPEEQLNILKTAAETVLLTKYHSMELDMVRTQPNLRQFSNGQKILYLSDTADVVSYINSSDIEIWVITGSFYVLSELKAVLVGSAVREGFEPSHRVTPI